MPRTVGVVLAHQGVGHLIEGLLTLYNLMGDAGINVKQKMYTKTKLYIKTYTSNFRVRTF